MPAAAAPSPSRRVRVGAIVLIWITTAVRAIVVSSPLAPRMADSTASGVGRIVKTASAPVAASSRLDAPLSPRAPRAVT